MNENHSGVVQVGLSNRQESDPDQGLQIRSPSIRSVDNPPQPVNLWEHLYTSGLTSRSRLTQDSGAKELADSFNRLAINPTTKQDAHTLRESSTQQSGDQPGKVGEEYDSEAHRVSDEGFREAVSEAKPGEYFLPAVLWPAKLSKGTCALSAGLLNSMGGTIVLGRRILIYKVPF